MTETPQYEQFHSIAFDRFESAETNDFDDFVTTLRKAPRFNRFQMIMKFVSEGKSVRFAITYDRDNVRVDVAASDDDLGVAAHQFVKDEFGLSNPNIPESDPTRRKNLHATIFLGRHFDDPSEQEAKKLSNYLRLLGFSVVDAERYQAEPIPNKVKRLIDGQDIYLGLVVGDREHNWLVAESAYAQGKEKHVILVIEEGSTFHPAIHGRDMEQIQFSRGRIEESFIRLLQEFRAIGINGL
jgi:hypothetical protein